MEIMGEHNKCAQHFSLVYAHREFYFFKGKHLLNTQSFNQTKKTKTLQNCVTKLKRKAIC